MKQLEQKRLETYKMKLTTISPVFIGGGGEVNKSMYILDNNVVKFVDETKLAIFLSQNNLMDDFVQLALKGDKEANLKDWLQIHTKSLANLPIFDYEIEVSKRYKKIKNFKTHRYENKETKSLNTIKTFVKNSDNLPYIPGSSIKGAIRSAYCVYMVGKVNKSYFQNKYWDKVKLALKRADKKELDKLVKSIEEACFLKIQYEDDKKGDRFSGLQISDSKPLSRDNLFVGQRNDFAIQNSEESPMPICLELLKPETDVDFTITVDTALAPNYLPEKIKTVLDYYTKFQKELIKEAFKGEKFNKIDYDIFDDANICIGGNNGYFSKSLIYALAPTTEDAVNALREYFSKCFDKGNKGHKHSIYDEYISPHTIKIVDNMLLGWCYIEKRKNLC